MFKYEKPIKVFAFAFIVFLFLMTGCSKPSHLSSPPGKIIDSKGVNKEEVAKKLFSAQLEEYKSINMFERNRIKDYSINNLKITKGNDFEFAAMINYSVLPLNIKENNWSRSGPVKENGWVEDITHFVTIIKEDSGYKIKSKGTSP